MQEKPTSPDGWAGLIRSYLKKKDVSGAAQSAEQALAASDHPRIRVARAEVLFRQGEIVRAEKEWADVINSGYAEVRAYLGLARVEGDVIRPRAENSKNGESRIVTFETGELSELMERREAARTVKSATGTLASKYIFHRKGEPIGDFRKAWAGA